MRFADKLALGYAYGTSLLSFMVDGPPRPFSATFAVTNRCNLRCAYCNCPFIDPTNLDLAQIDVLFGRLQEMGVCRLGDDRECTICQNSCPYSAIELVFSETAYTLVPTIDPQKCPGCGACEAACPTSPVRAIRILPSDRL